MIDCACIGIKPWIVQRWQCGEPTHRHDPNLHSHVTVTQSMIMSIVQSILTLIEKLLRWFRGKLEGGDT
jgi:hypothetical protein